jgi:hypothetical protein
MKHVSICDVNMFKGENFDEIGFNEGNVYEISLTMASDNQQYNVDVLYDLIANEILNVTVN